MTNILKLPIIRFAIVGIISNLILYALFLCLIFICVSNILSMTICYVLGVCQTFYFNKKWSFKNSGPILSSFLCYVVLYLSGYILNIISIYLLVSILGFNIIYIQAINIIVLALYLFLVQRFLIFQS